MTTAGNDTGNSREEELIARVYRQVTVCQADRYAKTYALSAGLARFGDWLNEHKVVDPDQAESASAAGNVRGRTSVAELLVVTESATEVKPEMLADEAVTELYSSHYRSLVRLAVLLVRDEPTAEEVVQECFIAMHDGWHRLRDQEKALSYLKQAVVNRSRSVLRHRSVIDRNAPEPAPDMPSAEQGAISLLERSAIDHRAARASGPATAGARAAVLRRPVGGTDRGNDGDQQGCGQEPHREGDVIAPRPPGGGPPDVAEAGIPA